MPKAVKPAVEPAWKEQARKVAIGAGVAAAGAALTYLSEWASGTDFGEWTPIVQLVLSVLANVARKAVAAR